MICFIYVFLYPPLPCAKSMLCMELFWRNVSGQSSSSSSSVKFKQQGSGLHIGSAHWQLASKLRLLPYRATSTLLLLLLLLRYSNQLHHFEDYVAFRLGCAQRGKKKKKKKKKNWRAWRDGTGKFGALKKPPVQSNDDYLVLSANEESVLLTI